jgi:hypothetical protein
LTGEAHETLAKSTFVLALTACAPIAAPTKPAAKARYPDLGTAPELAGDTWLNTKIPLRLADLRGKVVLVDMWTFG